jgi:hypothetical protein
MKISKEKINLINEIDQIIFKKFGHGKEIQYLRNLIYKIVINKTLPLEVINEIPMNPEYAGKTKFDQLYDAAMSVAFTTYSQTTLEKLTKKKDNKEKIWRVVLPEKFKIPHVIIKANSYQEAFAFGCDYACRISLRIHGKIPNDLQLKIMFISERSLKRHLKIKNWTRLGKRKKRMSLLGREFTQTEIEKAKSSALGDPTDSKYRIAKYIEEKDLKAVKLTGRTKITNVVREGKRKSR